MNNLEEVKKKIQVAVPEIMELKFGCKVETSGQGSICTIGTDYALDKEKNKLHTERFCNSCPPVQDFPITKILGRDINLENVLVAIKEKGTKFTFAIWVNENGIIKNIENDETTFWKLGQPLSKQSEVCILFLNELL